MARGGKPINNTGMPMIIVPLLALGLTAVGILSMKIAAARRRRIVMDHAEPDRVYDQRQHEWRDNHDQRGSVHERREYQSPISTQATHSEPRTAPTRSPTRSASAEMVKQLHRDLDRLLQSPTAP